MQTRLIDVTNTFEQTKQLYTAETEAAERKHTSLQSEIGLCKEKLSAEAASLATTITERDQLADQRDGLATDKAELETARDQLTSEKRAVETEKQAVDAELASVSNVLIETQAIAVSAAEAAEAKQISMQSEIDLFKDKLSAESASLATTIAERDQLADQRDGLASDKAELESVRDQLTTEKQAVETEKQAVDAELASVSNLLAETVDEAKIAAAVAQNKQTVMSTKFDNVKAKFMAEQVAKRNIQQELDTEVQSHRVTSAAHEHLAAEKLSLVVEQESLEAKNQTLGAELLSVQDRLSETKAAAVSAAASAAVCASEAAEAAEAKQISMQSEIDLFKDKLSAESASLATTIAERDQLADERDGLASDKAELESIRDQLTTEKQAVETEKQAVDAELASVSNVLAETHATAASADEAATAKQTSMQSEIDLIKDKLSTESASLARTITEREQLADERDGLATDKVKLENVRGQIVAENMALTAELLSLGDMLSQSKEDAVCAADVASTVQGSLQGELDEVRVQLQSQKIDTTQTIQRLDTRVQELVADRDANLITRRFLETELSMLRESAAAGKVHAAELALSLSNSQSLLESAQAELEETKTMCSDLVESQQLIAAERNLVSLPESQSLFVGSTITRLVSPPNAGAAARQSRLEAPESPLGNSFFMFRR